MSELHPSPPEAFSLTEVVLSLGIVSVVIVLLLAMLPTGLRSSRDSMEETRAIALLAAVEADLRMAETSPSPVFQLAPTPATFTNGSSTVSMTTNWFDRDGQRVGSRTNAFFGVRLRQFTREQSGANPAVHVNLQAWWPAQAAPTNAAGVTEIFSLVPKIQ